MGPFYSLFTEKLDLCRTERNRLIDEENFHKSDLYTSVSNRASDVEDGSGDVTKSKSGEIFDFEAVLDSWNDGLSDSSRISRNENLRTFGDASRPPDSNHVICP